MSSVAQLCSLLKAGDVKSLAQAITVVENELEGYKEILFSLGDKNIPVIGFTGSPGAGKSTLINAVVGKLSAAGKKIAVLAIDPTSPFNHGSLLGDRIRMRDHFMDPNVYIRSLATRGSLGGLSEKAIEITGVLKAAPFDLIIIETVGVGQSEVEIAGLADTTIVVFVPEGGDEIQVMKSGIVEIGDIFVVNKAEREGAAMFAKNLEQEIQTMRSEKINATIIQTTAINGKGIDDLMLAIEKHGTSAGVNRKKIFLLAEKAFRLIQKKRMHDIDKTQLSQTIEKAILASDFNLYKFADSYR
jgi:LAO/AO transport system kinase